MLVEGTASPAWVRKMLWNGKGAVPGTPGTAILLIGHTAITVKSVRCTRSDAVGRTHRTGDGPFQVEGRTVEYQ